MIISCLDLTPPTIRDPLDNLKEPALFVINGSNSSSFSWSENATSIGSIAPDRLLPDIGSAPSTTKCLSISDAITCNPKVGTKFAPDVVASSTALVDVPLFSTHLYIPPPLGLMMRFSPKLSCVHNLN